ncbi:hypothetical protein [Pseudomonas putida]|uniref:hypothetical protein n=1 Tax=Pseudomonas putida TaxID=303 RepID=UPI002B246804|nr:hypothetical protein [Pseudomonas putida]
MSFKDSFSQGLSAAAHAENQTKEIDSVFVELNEQIMEASGGKIEIYRRETYEEADLTGTITALTSVTGMLNRKKIVGIFAKNPNQKNPSLIGAVKIDKRGYPCEIKVGETRLICEDKSSLTKALNYLLADVEVGKTLTKIMAYKEGKPDASL